MAAPEPERRDGAASESSASTSTSTSTTTSASAPPTYMKARRVTAPSHVTSDLAEALSPSPSPVNPVMAAPLPTPTGHSLRSPSLRPTATAVPGTPELNALLGMDLADFSTFDLAGSDFIALLSEKLALQRTKLARTSAGRAMHRLAQQQRDAVNVLARRMAQPAAAMQRDKISFVFGVTYLWVTALLVGAAPWVIPLLYLAKIVVLLGLRFAIYRRKRWHYFMFDMCYYVNLLLVLLLLFPRPEGLLYTAVWGLATGPTLTAIIAWRNSLVFHSLDKVTSLIIHFEPPLVMFVLRWTDPAMMLKRYAPMARAKGPGPMTMILVSLAAYITWQSAYWVFIWRGRRDKIREGYATSTTHLLADRKSPVFKLTHRLIPRFRPAAFVVVQLFYTLLTLLPTPLYWSARWVHATYLVIVLSLSIWRGACFYFEVFSKRYVAQLRALEGELQEIGGTDANGGTSSTHATPQPHDAAAMGIPPFALSAAATSSAAGSPMARAPYTMHRTPESHPHRLPHAAQIASLPSSSSSDGLASLGLAAGAPSTSSHAAAPANGLPRSSKADAASPSASLATTGLGAEEDEGVLVPTPGRTSSTSSLSLTAASSASPSHGTAPLAHLASAQQQQQQLRQRCPGSQSQSLDRLDDDDDARLFIEVRRVQDPLVPAAPLSS